MDVLGNSMDLALPNDFAGYLLEIYYRSCESLSTTTGKPPNASNQIAAL